MKKTLFTIIGGINLTVLILFMGIYLNALYPLVGHDYNYFLTRIFDTYLFQRVNGLAVQWYTPSFMGGAPVFANPQSMQYSLVQLLTALFQPWTANLVAIGIYLVVGFCACFYFCRRILGLTSPSSILGAIFFCANGYFIQHQAVGHITFQTFPLLAVMAVVLFGSRFPAWIHGMLAGLGVAIILYAGSFYQIIYFAFSFLVTLPLLYLLRPNLIRWRRLAIILSVGFLFAILMGGSKIYAVFAFMRTFPRLMSDYYDVSMLSQILGLATQLLGSMTLLPALALIHKSAMTLVVRSLAWTGSPYSFWEIDCSLSPALFLILFVGTGYFVYRLIKSIKGRRSPRLSRAQWAALVLLAAAIYTLLEFIFAKGFLYSGVQTLPVFQSMRVNSRFTSALIFPLCILGGWLFDRWYCRCSSAAWRWTAFGFLDALALATLWSYFLLPMRVQVRNFNVSQMSVDYAKAQEGEIFPVKNVYTEMNDWEVFMAGGTNLRTADTFMMDFYAPTIHDGPVSQVEDGAFNLHDPTGFVFPEVNDSYPYSKIPIEEKEQFEDFINRRLPQWNLPGMQRVLDGLSLASLGTILASLLVYAKRTGFRHRDRKPV